MGRGTNKLSARAVASLSEEGDYADGGGLYLTVSKGGSKRWEFWYKREGTRHKPPLGPYPANSLVDRRGIRTPFSG
jgi:hypothetical protein